MFKTEYLKEIWSLFPAAQNPFHAVFGNRHTVSAALTHIIPGNDNVHI